MANYSNYLDYSEANVRKYVPTSAGVYMLATVLQSGSYSIIYVGQSDNLERRLLEHLNSNEPNACIRSNVRDYKMVYTWVEIGRQADRNAEELAKYEKYKPKCNLQRPPA